MSVLHCLILVAVMGAVGGLAACFHKDAVVLPKFDKRAKIWKPGAIGTVLSGAVAAGLVWALSRSCFKLRSPKNDPTNIFTNFGSIGWFCGDRPCGWKDIDIDGSTKGRSIHEGKTFKRHKNNRGHRRRSALT